MFLYNIKFCLEYYKSPIHLQKEPDLVMFVYNTIEFCIELCTAPTQKHMKWGLTSTVWLLSQYSDSLEAGPYVLCLLAEVGDFPSLQYIGPILGPI